MHSRCQRVQQLVHCPQVDYVPSKAMSAEEIAQQQQMFESISKATRSVRLDRFGEAVDMQVRMKGPDSTVDL